MKETEKGNMVKGKIKRKYTRVKKEKYPRNRRGKHCVIPVVDFLEPRIFISISEAAAVLKISRPTVVSRINSYKVKWKDWNWYVEPDVCPDHKEK